MTMPSFQPYRRYPGGFSTRDGTLDFYLRVRSYAKADSVVLDLGAGRAAWYDESSNDMRQRIRHLTPDAAELIAADSDPVVLDNKSSTRNIVLSKGVI